MDSKFFEARLREGEKFHGARLPQDFWIVLRVDGHGFTKLTGKGFQKPFDIRFRDGMKQVATALLESLGGVYAYTESDEVSLLLPRDWALFGRSHEKAISLSAGLASAVFSRALELTATFDSRVWLGKSVEEVGDYFRWRQTDATRCALNGWCYWTLRQSGESYAAATAALRGRSRDAKCELLLRHNVDFEELPSWQRRGLGLSWETYQVQGANPLTGQQVAASRRRITVNEELPVGDEYTAFIASLLDD